MGRKFYNIKFENNSFTFKSMQTQDKAVEWTRQKMSDGQRSNSKILWNNVDSGKMSIRKGQIVRTIFTLEYALS